MPIRNLIAALVLAVAAVAAPAQFGVPDAPAAPSGLKDTSSLKPPAGARVALVEFADLQCPACARANPYLMAVAAKYHIPWVRHDFLIPYHSWSRQAAVFARWFDSQKEGLGEQYRNQVFENQVYFLTYGMLRSFTDKFATDNGLALPVDADPKGEFAAAIAKDIDQAHALGLNKTPSIFVVSAGSKGLPFIQVEDAATLDQIVEQALADTTK
jgi:protein-disulfide isomerase